MPWACLSKHFQLLTGLTNLTSVGWVSDVGWCRLSMWGPKRCSVVQCSGMWCRVPGLVWKIVHFSEIECRVCERVGGTGGTRRNMRAADKLLWKHQLRCLLPTIWKHQALSAWSQLTMPMVNNWFRNFVRLTSDDNIFEILVNVWNMNPQSIIVVIITVAILGNPELSDQIIGKGKNMWGLSWLLTHTHKIQKTSICWWESGLGEGSSKVYKASICILSYSIELTYLQVLSVWECIIV